MSDFQHTISKPIEIQGIGVHSGKESYLKLLPAKENHGIVFKRIDLKENNIIAANFDNVIDTTLCTVIGNPYGASVSTVEHLMSALWGCGIDNVIVEVDSAEVPVMDGSSLAFTNLIMECGIKKQNAFRKILKILKPIELMVDDKKIEILPSEDFIIDYTIQFASKAIGVQSFIFKENQTSFKEDISKARTFGFMKDLAALNKIGLGKGVNLSNSIGITDDGILNKEGLRYGDEFVRHKVLDCIGDLYLAGARIKGHVKAFKAGHALNNKLLRKLFANKDAYVFIEERKQFYAA
ncbi:UDP-3-O-acyl-N-acetylglucosamine deacetylase [Candidatus Jidaibacter acanthamoebae]|nr:UDP-3-O-acyl-N-acetylglucosamine deacetylase [Candidatus Jidaibacter acanthamoeba]